MDYSYPLPKKSLISFAQKVFGPLKRGECATALFVAGGGKRTKIDFLLSEKTILKQIFKDKFENTLLVKIAPGEILEISNLAYLNLILEKLTAAMKASEIPTPTTASSNPLEAIKKTLAYLVNQGKEVIFLLDDFEFTFQLSPSIFSNLESLKSVSDKKIRCLILSHFNLLEDKLLMKMGHFKYLATKNVCYVPLHAGEDRDYIINRLAKGLSITIPSKTKKVLTELCDGHPRMLNYALTFIFNQNLENLKKPEEIRSALLKNEDLRMVSMDVWNPFNKVEREILKYVAFNKTLKPAQKRDAKFLLKTNIIQEKGKKLALFGQIFNRFVKTKITREELTFNPETGQISLGPMPCSNQFTNQEHKLLVYFTTNEGQVLSRDNVAEVLWGKNNFDKYSDWAIDKLISSIRKKLDKIGFPSKKLVTLKKRGFCLLT